MFQIYLGYIVPSVVVFPMWAAILRYHFLPFTYRILFLFIIVSTISNIIGTTVAHMGINNMYVFHFYTVVEFLIISAFYHTQFAGNATAQRLINIAAAIFTIICLVNPLFFQNLSQFDSYSSSLEAILINIMSIALINKESQSLNLQRWKDNPLNWFNTGILIYFSASMFLFLFSNYLLKAPLLIIHVAWYAHGAFLMLMYMLFAIGFYKCRK